MRESFPTGPINRASKDFSFRIISWK